jgi:RNA polymerase nonessential primary-like sigma factor
VDEIIECLDKESELISLDVEYGDSNISLLDSLADLDTQNTLQNLVDQEISVSLSRWINTLNEEHRQVLYWRFGFGSNETLTLKEIANNWGISLERVRQIQNKAIKTLRCRIEKDGLSADSIFP